MMYTIDRSIKEFEPWSGARHTWECLLNRGDLYEIEEIVDEYFNSEGQIPSETEINDLLWFEQDLIAEWLGYENWEDYLERKQPLYEPR